MVKVDVKDRKILYYLSQDGRLTDSALAKLVGLSKNAVAYRIERLKKESVISHFGAVVNLGNLNLTTCVVIFRFNDDVLENPAIIDFFAKHPFADWVALLSGQWDIIAEFVIKDLFHITEILQGAINHFSTKLNAYRVFFSHDILRVEHLVGNFYAGLQLQPIGAKARPIVQRTIDDCDRRVLSLLNQDSSLSVQEIARRLDLTGDVVRYRMKRLQEMGIIIRYTPEISLQALGYAEYLFMLKLHNMTTEAFARLRTFIASNDNVTYAFSDLTSYHIIFSCAFRDPEGIDDLSRHLRKNFGEVIDEQVYLLVTSQVLFNLFPQGIGGAPGVGVQEPQLGSPSSIKPTTK